MTLSTIYLPSIFTYFKYRKLIFICIYIFFGDGILQYADFFQLFMCFDPKGQLFINWQTFYYKIR